MEVEYDRQTCPNLASLIMTCATATALEITEEESRMRKTTEEKRKKKKGKRGINHVKEKVMNEGSGVRSPSHPDNAGVSSLPRQSLVLSVSIYCTCLWSLRCRICSRIDFESFLPGCTLSGSHKVW